MWKLQYDEKADKILMKLDHFTRKKIIAYLETRILNNPTAFGKPLTNDLKGLWRYRIGDYRILCEIKDKELIVLIIDIGHRREIYNKE